MQTCSVIQKGKFTLLSLQDPTPHHPGFCLNVFKKLLTTRPPEKESASEKDHQCERVQGEGEIEN